MAKANDMMVAVGVDPVESARDYYVSLQRVINDGSIWHMEGSAGRNAMDAIKMGYVMVGVEARKDYWGNTVPARSMLEAGSFGTREFVAEHNGEEWAAAMEGA
jgi:hypothetical protein